MNQVFHLKTNFEHKITDITGFIEMEIIPDLGDSDLSEDIFVLKNLSDIPDQIYKEAIVIIIGPKAFYAKFSWLQNSNPQPQMACLTKVKMSKLATINF